MSGRTQRMKDRTKEMLKDPNMTADEAWRSRAPRFAKVLESEDGESCAIATLGARNNETEDGILAMAGLLMDGDYGVLRYESDRRLNEANRKLETGLIMGVYEASHDGTELVATQRHRFEPPTVMLPDER